MGSDVGEGAVIPNVVVGLVVGLVVGAVVGGQKKKKSEVQLLILSCPVQ